MIRRVLTPLAFMALFATPLAAQPVPPDLEELTDIAAQPYLTRDEVVARLGLALPDFLAAPPDQPRMTETDPFFWAIRGRFGPPLQGAPAPGGVVACARYGRLTLEALALRQSTDPDVFPVWQQALILPDDAEAWPGPAVARLACAITWDDARRVAPLAAQEVSEVLDALFDAVTHRPDPRERPGQTRVFGPGGYRIAAVGAVENSLFRLDLFEVDQLATHHQILFRSYLIGGGV